MKIKRTITLFLTSATIFCMIGCSALKKERTVEINHKIVGKWSSKNIAGTSLITTFKKDGTATVSKDGKEISSQKYRLIDPTTLETETNQGAKYTATLEFSDNDNTMMVTDFTKQKTPYKREQ